MTSALARIDAAAHQGFVAVNDNRAPTTNNDLALLLGEVRGELVGMREDVAEVKAALSVSNQNDIRINEKIGLIDKRLENVESSVTVMGGVVAKQTTRIDKIEPLALWLIAIAGGLLVVGGALWFGIMNYGAAVLDWIVSLRQPPKP